MKFLIILTFFSVSNQLFSIENSLDTLTNPKNECDIRPAFLPKQAPKIMYPLSLKKLGIQGDVYLTYFVNENGNLSNVKILGGLEKEAQDAVLKAFSAIKLLKPAQLKGKNIPYIQLDTARLRLSDLTEKISLKENFEKKYDNWSNFEKNINKTTSNDFVYNFDAEYYLLNDLKFKYMSWKTETAKDAKIDVSKTKTTKIEKIDFNIEVGKHDLCNVYLFSPSTSSFSMATENGKNYTKKLASQNQQVLIVAFKYTKEKAFLAIKETTIDEKSGLDLVFEPVSMELLKASFSKLH